MIPKFLFDFLSAKRKYNYLWHNGLLIGTKKELGQTVHLYMVGDYFAEVGYKAGDHKDIRWVKTFAQIAPDRMVDFYGKRPAVAV